MDYTTEIMLPGMCLFSSLHLSFLCIGFIARQAVFGGCLKAVLISYQVAINPMKRNVLSIAVPGKA
jgi:hypothetical protein